MYRKTLAIVVIFLTAHYINAQDVDFKIEAPSKVKVGQQFQITYTANAKMSEFTPPTFRDFDLIFTNQSTRSVNWNTVHSINYHFICRKAGTYKIPPATAKFKKKRLSTRELEIEVVASSGTNSGGSAGGTSNKGTTSSPSVSSNTNEEVFVRLVASKTRAYVGEQITVWAKVYTTKDIAGVQQDFAAPDFNGFYKQDIEVEQLRQLVPEDINGTQYFTGELRKFIIYPQKTGEITIKPVDIIVAFNERVRVGYFTQNRRRNETYSTKPLKFNIAPLPVVGKPSDFNGAIGNFSISATQSANKVNTNDALNIKVKVSGTGNIKLLEEPSYKLPAGFELALDPIVKTSMNNNGISGTRSYEYTIIPRHAGEFTIKPFRLSYFNPQSKKYNTVATQAFNIKVNRSEGDTNSVIISNLSREEIEFIDKDILYIQTESRLVKKGKYLTKSLFYYLTLVILITLFLLTVYFKKEQIKKQKDVQQLKNKRAGKIIRKRLKVAQKLLKENKTSAFYEELTRALWGYLSDKLQIPLSTLTSDTAKEVLLENGINNEIVDKVLNIAETCDFARYAPGASDNQPDKLFKLTKETIINIEQNI